MSERMSVEELRAMQQGNRGRRKLPTPETILKGQIKKYLAFKGWLVLYFLQGTGCYKGLSDLCAIKAGRVIWIEVKRPGAKDCTDRLFHPGGSRGYQSTYQEQFEADIKAHGGEYLVARSLDDLIRAGV